MPMRKPRADETQAHWNDYCFSELKDSDLEQNQKIAICLQAWRDRNKALKAAERWSCGASRDLPIAETERDWDGSAAAGRMLDKASDAEGNVKAAQARRGFLIYDAANSELRGSYSCPFADVVDGTLKVIPSGLRAAASRLPQVTDVSQDVKDRARGVLDAYFGRLEEKGLTGISNKQDYNGYEAPGVEEDETRTEYIERCVADLTEDGASDEEASSLCALAWENRSGSRRLRQKTHVETVHGMEFVLSDETPDRMGDVISAEGFELTSFKKNPIALFNHLASFPIGKWTNLRVEHGALRGHLQLAPEGTSDRIDEIRRLIEADILKAVSVGFRPIQSQPRRVGEKVVGEHFLRQELVETSLVSVPANPNALAIAKQLDISDATLDVVFAQHGRRDITKRTVVNRSGEHAITPLHRKEGAMSPLSQRIQDRQTRLVALRDELSDHLAEVDDDNVSDSQLDRTKELNDQIKREQEHLAALVEAEKNTMGTTALATTETKTKSGNGSVAKPYISTQRTPQIPTKREDRLELIVKAGVIRAFAHTRKVPAEIARQGLVEAGYPQYSDDTTRVFADYLARAEAAPAMTTVVGWAAELSQTTYADYVDLLYAKSVFRQLSGHALSLSFGNAGQISIPYRDALPSIAGSFVGEGMPIPVRQAGFRSQVLTRKKVAVITTFTREMSEASVPAIEGVLRAAIQEDTAGVIDNVLMDNVAADAIRPAGLLNGVTPIAATAGGDFNALVTDLKNLIGALLAATAGNLRDVVLLMNPQERLSASLKALPGVSVFPFMADLSGGRLLGHTVIESGGVPLGTIVAIDAADFVIVGGAAPRFEVSDQATLAMEDTDPQPIVGGTPSPAPVVRSLWQTDSLGLRLILPVNWAMRRADMIAAVSGVTW